MKPEEIKEKIRNFLDEIGMNEESKALFSIAIQDMLAKFIEAQLLETFTDEEFIQIEMEAGAQDVADEDRPLLLNELFRQKHDGKSVQDMALEFLYDFLSAMKKNMELLRKVINKVETEITDPKQRQDEIVKYTDILVDKNVNTFTSHVKAMTNE